MNKLPQENLNSIQGRWFMPLIYLLPGVISSSSRPDAKRLPALGLQTFAETMPEFRTSELMMRSGWALQLGALGALGLETRRQAGGQASHSLRWSGAAPVKGWSIQPFCQLDRIQSLSQALQVRGACGFVLPHLGLFAAVGPRSRGGAARGAGWGYRLAWRPLASAGARGEAFQGWRRVGAYMAAGETKATKSQRPAAETEIGEAVAGPFEEVATPESVRAEARKLAGELEDWYEDLKGALGGLDREELHFENLQNNASLNPSNLFTLDPHMDEAILQKKRIELVMPEKISKLSWISSKG